MVKSWAMGSLLALGALSTARAACEALSNYLDIPSPLTEDTTITLSVGVIECPPLDANTNAFELEQIIIEGGTLTIVSDNTVQFINVGFRISSGAALVFDMPETLFGPNDRSHEDYPAGFLLDVSNDASLTFNGDVTIEEVENLGSVLTNAGNTEFKKTALIVNNINAIPGNTGFLKFGGDATFRGNYGVGIENHNGGIVRFSGTATFDDNGSDLDGFKGCEILNELTSTMSFRGDATFSNTKCRSSEGTSLYNAGTMTFYGKARFDDITASGNGGAVRNHLGSMTFRSDAQFNNNDASQFGGGIAVEGGDVTFQKAVTFSGNTAYSGGAFAVLFGTYFERGGVVIDSGFGSLTFEEPSQVRFEGNTATKIEGDDSCTVGEVEEEATLIGFLGDDVCVAAT